MSKVIDYLNKKYDDHFFKSKYIKEKSKEMEINFKNNKIEFSQKSELDFFRNEIINQGLINKMAIEDAYFVAKNTMNDYYDTLDYEEKSRMINVEVNKALEKLPYEIINQEQYYIPFFDARMNQVYRNEMVLFDLKLYHRFQFDFREIYQEDCYGFTFFDDHFTSAKRIYQKGNDFTLYVNKLSRIYFFKDNKLVDHLTLIKDVNKELLNQLSEIYFTCNETLLIKFLSENELIRNKELKKVNKILEKSK